jgi:hypothetical protein
MRSVRRIDLSQTMRHGMATYWGLPAPAICELLSREASPLHRHAPGKDRAQLPLQSPALLEAMMVEASMVVEASHHRAIARAAFRGIVEDGCFDAP